MPTIKVRYLDPEMPRLERLAQGDWIDVRARERITYHAGDLVKVPLGIAVQLPAGFEAHVAARSSTGKNYGLFLANGVGVVDESYAGNDDEWFAVFFAMRNGTIEKYDRIAQFRIMEKMPPVDLEEVSQLTGPNRGGHGSTGRQ